jgi:hypothetical protein
MITADRIQHCVEALPESMQEQVLQYAESLKSMIGESGADNENQQWSDLSLALALRGMEEEEPDYTEADLKEKFS